MEFESDKINVFYRGSDIMVAIPEGMVEHAGAVKASLARMFQCGPSAVVANNAYNGGVEGFSIWRLKGVKRPKQPVDPSTGKFISWSLLHEIRDESRPKAEFVVLGPDKPRTAKPTPAEGTVTVRSEDLSELLAAVEKLVAALREAAK